ncbi:MAG TPA: DNA-binding response regulator [Bacteroidales bacterium]|nr:DNA-binding response regulator [Bacteroidales bacterium]
MEERKRLFLVEDDLSFGSVLKSYLEMHQYKIELVIDGKLALEVFKKGNFDLCIFDVMLPHIDGFQLAESIKKINPNIPFIFLTAKTLRADEVKGYQLGADDYIKKPFDSEILLFKLKAILNRKTDSSEKTNTFRLGKFVLNPEFRELIDQQENSVQKLSPKEAELLQLFVENKEKFVAREEALRKIWGDDNYFTKRSMDVYVTKLRKYLSTDTSIEILNIHGSGFRLVCRK